MRVLKTYPRIVRCRFTGMQAMVDGRPAEVVFRLMAPCAVVTALAVWLALVLLVGVLA